MKTKADILSTDAALIAQSTATDADVALLTEFFGFQLGQSVNFSSASTATGWAASLSGTYLGTALNVSYLADMSGFPGPITWTDTGTYGTNLWTGSGSMTITNPTATTFEATFIDSLMIGDDSASIDYVIPGTVQPDGSIMFGDPSDEEVGSGTASITENSAAAVGIPKGIFRIRFAFSYRQVKINGKWVRILSDIVLIRDGQHPPKNLVNNYIPLPDDPIGGRGTISTIPEPSAWTLMLAGMGAVCVLGRRGAIIARPHQP